MTPRCLPAVSGDGLHSRLEKKRLVQQTVRKCEGWEEMEERGEKVKAEEREKRKDHIQEEIDRASEKTERGERLF